MQFSILADHFHTHGVKKNRVASEAYFMQCRLKNISSLCHSDWCACLKYFPVFRQTENKNNQKINFRCHSITLKSSWQPWPQTDVAADDGSKEWTLSLITKFVLSFFPSIAPRLVSGRDRDARRKGHEWGNDGAYRHERYHKIHKHRGHKCGQQGEACWIYSLKARWSCIMNFIC